MNVAFIPIRYGSKTIPQKNIKIFCGKPLVYWCLNAVQECNKIDKVIVASDSKKINSIIQNFNFSKVEIFHRSKKNSKDTSSTESVMLECINEYNFNNNDLFILVQATSPLVQKNDFDFALKKFYKSDCESLLTCTKTKRFFWSSEGVPLNYNYKNRPRRQDNKGTLMENGSFYINSIKNIKKYKNRISENICIYEMPHFTSIEIDDEDDWKFAEILMRKHILNKNTNGVT